MDGLEIRNKYIYYWIQKDLFYITVFRIEAFQHLWVLDVHFLDISVIYLMFQMFYWKSKVEIWSVYPNSYLIIAVSRRLNSKTWRHLSIWPIFNSVYRWLYIISYYSGHVCPPYCNTFLSVNVISFLKKKSCLMIHFQKIPDINTHYVTV